MRGVVIPHQTDFAAWRTAARGLALAAIPPEQTVWSVGEAGDLLAEPPEDIATEPTAAFTVPRALVTLAETVIQASDPARFALLYTLIWRAHRGERHLLEQTTDPLVHRANRLAQSVRRDTHKMRAFLRFREVRDGEAIRHVAWFEPAHYIVEANAAFFVRRFAGMIWSILTPYRSAHWNGETLSFGPGASAAEVPDDDALEAYWRTYFSAIFNPARLKIGAMTSEMPRKYWKNMPETAAIPELVRMAGVRTEAMIEQTPQTPRPHRAWQSVAPKREADTELERLAEQAADCRNCPLWSHATQTVFGEGLAASPLMFVGEQPGDQEDLAGRPFVGPAGQLLDRALAEAGIDRTEAYVTNAVKHFKFEPRGKRRIHQTPDVAEITACAAWLAEERRLVNPRVTILLGASAARAVLGRPVTIGRERGRPISLPDGATGFVTVHPSYLLRLPDEAAKAREYDLFLRDLRMAAALLVRA